MSSADFILPKQEKLETIPVSAIFTSISTIPENISKLKTAFEPRQFEEVEAILLYREGQLLRNIEDLKAQVQTLGVQNNDLERKYEDAASKNVELEVEAKKWKREREEFEEKLTRANEDLDRTQTDVRVLVGREKRAGDRYVKLSDDYDKEVIKNKEELAKLKEKIGEADESAKMWRKKYEGCVTIVKKCEDDTALILRSDPAAAKAVEVIRSAGVLDINDKSTRKSPESTVPLGKHSSDMGKENSMHMKNQEGHESGCSKQMMSSSRIQRTGTGMEDAIEIDDSDDERHPTGTVSASLTAKDDGRSCKKDPVILSNGKRPLGTIVNKDLDDDDGSSQNRKRRMNISSPNMSESSDSSAYMDSLVYGKSNCRTFKFEADLHRAINEDNENQIAEHSNSSCREFSGFSPSDSIRKRVDKGKKKVGASSSKGKKKATKKGKGKGKEKAAANKGKGKGKAPAEPEEEESDGESDEEDPLVPPHRKEPGTRGQSKGIYGKPVTHIRHIDLSAGRIKDKVAKHTLSAIVHAKWPLGLYSYGEITRGKPDWQDKIINEFYTYYKHMKGQSRRDGRDAIITNIKSIVKNTMCDEKRRALRRSKKFGKGLEECNPGYWGEAFWAWLVSYWSNSKHLKRSKASSENREKLKHLHSSGAMSFVEQEDAWVRDHGGVPPSRLQLWKHTHTNKETGKMTAEAKEIMERYGAILDRIPPEQCDEEPIEWWMEATVQNEENLTKNRLLMYPHTPASQLIPNLAHNYRQRHRNGAGGSSAASRQRSTIPDPQFLAIVAGTIRRVRDNPRLYCSRQLSDEETRALAKAVLDRSPSTGGATGQPLQQFIIGEAVRVVRDIIDDMFQRYELGPLEAPRGEEEGEESSEGDFTSSDSEDPGNKQ